MHKGHDDQFDTESHCSSNSSFIQGSHERSSSGISNVSEAWPSQFWKRDEEFYMEDGSCVLLVGDTLFNVAVQLLVQAFSQS
jgi:hypothetical protein